MIYRCQCGFGGSRFWFDGHIKRREQDPSLHQRVFTRAEVERAVLAEREACAEIARAVGRDEREDIDPEWPTASIDRIDGWEAACEEVASKIRGSSVNLDALLASAEGGDVHSGDRSVSPDIAEAGATRKPGIERDPSEPGLAEDGIAPASSLLHVLRALRDHIAFGCELNARKDVCDQGSRIREVYGDDLLLEIAERSLGQVSGPENVDAGIDPPRSAESTASSAILESVDPLKQVGEVCHAGVETSSQEPAQPAGPVEICKWCEEWFGNTKDHHCYRAWEAGRASAALEAEPAERLLHSNDGYCIVCAGGGANGPLEHATAIRVSREALLSAARELRKWAMTHGAWDWSYRRHMITWCAERIEKMAEEMGK